MCLSYQLNVVGIQINKVHGRFQLYKKYLMININLCVLVALCILGIVSEFVPRNSTFSLPNGVTEFDYSPNHEYLGAITTSTLNIYHTQTGKPIQQPITDNSLTFSSFSFNSDNSVLAAGFVNGEVHIYKLINGTYSKDEELQYKHINSSIVQTSCFLDKHLLVFGLLQRLFIVWDLQTNITYPFTFGQDFITTISCSPTDPTLFVVGGSQNAKSKFTYYNFINNNITEKTDVPSPDSSNTLGSTFSQDGTHIFRTEINGQLYRYNSSGQDETLIYTEPTGLPITKIRVSQNQRIIVTLALGAQDKLVILTQQSSGKKLKAYTPTKIDTSSLSFAFSTTGSYFLYLDASGATVVSNQCHDNQFPDANGVCTVCDQSCLFCDGSANNCFACSAKYYLSVNQCLSCSPGCLQCSSDTDCTKCDTNFHQDGGFCVCDDGFFPDGTGQTCNACEPVCKTCKKALECETCRDKFVINEQTKLCQCKPGTYQQGQICLDCIRGCDKCSDAITCQTCSISGHYVKKADDDTCVCDDSKHFVDNIDNTACVCKVGFYDKDGVCLACPVNCEQCGSATDCTQCKGQLLPVQGICECTDSGQWINNTDFTCVNCNATLDFCIKCNTAAQCLQCKDGLDRQLQEGHCLCKAGYYNDSDNICQTCNIDGCLKCTDTQHCTQCDSGEHWQPFNQLCQCTQHWYDAGGVCQKCSAGCLKCNAQNCTECDVKDHWIKDATNQCICENAYYPQGEVCQSCIVGCLQCTNGTACNLCDQSRHFRSQEGLCVCTDDTLFIKDQQCVSCSQLTNHCTHCPKTVCNKCEDPFILSDKFRCVCEQGKYEEDGKCPECPDGCKTCDSADVCTACNDDYSLDEQTHKCTKNGIDTLVIVLIVVGVVVLAGAVFVIIKCIKKRKSPLSQDDYQEL